MSKPDWKDAPEWAQVLLVQHGFNGPLYCWAGYHGGGAKAHQHEDIGLDQMIFNLAIRYWTLVERRP